MTIEALGKKFNEKYPDAYNDMSDSEVGARALRKYPEYKDIADAPPEPTQPKGKVLAVDMPPAKKPSGAGRSFDKGPFRTIGAAMGGTAGSIIGGVAGQPVKGTMIGAALGEGAGQMWEQGQYPPTMVGGVMVPGSMGSSDVDPVSMAQESAVQGAFEGAGGLLAPTIKKAAYWGTGKLKSGADELANAFKGKYGGELTYSDLTKSSGGDTLQNIAEKSFFGGNRMKNFHEYKQAIPIQKGLKSIADDIATNKYTMDEAADLVASGALGERKLRMKVLGKAWEQMDEFVGRPAVDVSETIKLLEDIVAKAPARGNESSKTAAALLRKFKPPKQEMSKVLDATGKQFPLTPQEPPGMITWERAHIEQSDLFDVSPIGKQMQTDADKANLKRIRGSILKAMQESAKKVGPEAYELWKNIRTEYGKAMEPYTIRWIKQVMNTEGGENIARKIFAQKSPKIIGKLRSIVPEEQWRNFQAAWLEGEAAEIIKSQEGLFDVGSFINKIGNMKGFDAIFSGPQKKSIDELIKIARLIGEESGSGKSGAIFIQMKQASAASNLASGGIIGGAAGIGTGSVLGGVATGGMWLGGPAVLARILTNPTATKYFTRSIKEGGKADYLLKALDVISRFGARETGSVAKDYTLDEQTMKVP